MAGIEDIPGYSGVSELIDPDSLHNRVIRAQVAQVDNENGYVVLNYDGVPSGGRHATVNPLWMSFPSPRDGGPSWGRFMPQRGDLVKLGFDFNDHPQILGFDIEARKEGVADSISGWPQLKSIHETAAKDPSAKITSVIGNKKVQISVSRFAEFVPLKPGEYDFMSSGGAYIHGNNLGRLYLAGGLSSIKLSKNDLRITQNSQLLSHTADDSEFRFGQVRRLQPDFSEPAVSGGEINKEFRVKLKNSVSPGVSLNLADLQIGNVVNDVGAVEQVDGVDARLLLRLNGAAGAQAFEMSVDKNGNWTVKAPAFATTGVKFDFPVGNWNTTFKESVHNSTIKTSLVSPSVNLGSQTPVEQLILGTTYRIQESSLHNGVNAKLGTIIGNLTAAIAGLGVVSGGLATEAAGIGGAAALHIIPVAGPIVGAVPLAAAVAGIGVQIGGIVTVASQLAAIAAQLSLIIADITVFEAQSFRYLSNTSKTI